MQKNCFWNIISFTISILVVSGHPDNYLNYFTSRSMKGHSVFYNLHFSGTLESCARECTHALHLSCTSFMFACGYERCSAYQTGDCFFVNDIIKTHNSRNITSISYMRKYAYSPSTWICNGRNYSTRTSSVIVSPFFPRIVRQRRTCYSTIRTNHNIQLTFYTWLGSEDFCHDRNGYFEVTYDRNGRESRERICPDKLPYVIRSPGNTMSLKMNKLGLIVFKATSVSVAADDCGIFRCKNGGTCVAVGGDLFCICVQSYTGRYCEVSVSSCQHKGCENNSTCAFLSNNETICICATGFEGERCDVRTNYICDDKECGHGICRLNLGEEPHRKLANDDLSDDLEDYDSYHCECDSGYTGKRCQNKVEDCISDPCSVNECMTSNYTYICVCSMCHFGFCISGNKGNYCMCFPGYTGEHCTINIDECTNNPCGIHGTCIDYVNAYKCTCEPYYVGDHCEKCISDSCSEGIKYPMVIINPMATAKTKEISVPSDSSSWLQFYSPRTSTIPYSDFTTADLKSRLSYSKESKKLLELKVKESFILCIAKQLLDSICSCESYFCNSTSTVTRMHCANKCFKDILNSCGNEYFCVSESCMIWWLYFSLYVQSIFSKCAYGTDKAMVNSSGNDVALPRLEALTCIKHSYVKGFNLRRLGLVDFRQDCNAEQIDLPSNFSCFMSTSNISSPYKKCKIDYFHVCVERVLPISEGKLFNIVVYNLSNIEVQFNSRNQLRFYLCIKNVNDNGEEDVIGCTTAKGTFGCVSYMSICATSPCLHGLCHDDADGINYKCICEKGYSGENCTISADKSAVEESCPLKSRLVAAIYILVVLLVLQTFVTAIVCSCRGNRQKQRGSVNLDHLVYPESDDEPKYLYSKYSYFDDEEDMIQSFRERNYRNMWNVTQTISGVELGKSEA